MRPHPPVRLLGSHGEEAWTGSSASWKRPAVVVALLVMFVAIIVQVFFRYLFTPLIWPFELSIFMYICLIYLGAALAARRDSHVAFDVLFNALPVEA